MTRIVTLKELRPKLSKVIEAVDKSMDRFIVTRRGHPQAVILGTGDYESLLETIEILQNKPLLRRLKKAQQDVKKTGGVSLAKIHRDLGLI